MHKKSNCNWLSSNTFTVKMLICLAAIISPQTRASSVESLSDVMFKHIGEEAFWRVMVKCEGSSASIAIRQKLKQANWCTEDMILPCVTSKVKMAEQVCLNVDIAKASNSSTATRTSAPIRQPNAEETAQAQRTAKAQQQANARRKAQQQAKKEQRLALAVALEADQIKLQQERDKLEQEKLAVEQEERELNAKQRELETQLRALDN